MPHSRCRKLSAVRSASAARARRRSRTRSTSSALHARAIPPPHFEHHRGIELAKRFSGHVEAGDDERRTSRGSRRGRAGPWRSPPRWWRRRGRDPRPAPGGRGRDTRPASAPGSADHHASAGFSVIWTAGSAAAFNTSVSVREAAFRSRSTSLRQAMASSVDAYTTSLHRRADRHLLIDLALANRVQRFGDVEHGPLRRLRRCPRRG